MNARRWTGIAVACLMGVLACLPVGAVTFTDTDDYGIKYTATVTPVSGNTYSVSVTINTTGYTGSQTARLDWFRLKLSPQSPASVTNLNLPAGYSYGGTSGGDIIIQTPDVGPPSMTPDGNEIVIPTSGTKPVILFGFWVDLNNTHLMTDGWPYQARYLFQKPEGGYKNDIISRTMQPQGGVIPEPATLVLFGMGLVAPLAARWRKP
jgi:hypothetical protein